MGIFDKAIGGRTLKDLTARTPKVGGRGVVQGKAYGAARPATKVFAEKASGLRPGKGQGFKADYTNFMKPGKRSLSHTVISGVIW